MMNGLAHHYHLVESTFIFKGVRSDFEFLFHFSMKILLANKLTPDGVQHTVASYLGLYCLPVSHKKDARFFFTSQIIQYL